jgi:hypothetical protein
MKVVIDSKCATRHPRQTGFFPKEFLAAGILRRTRKRRSQGGKNEL